MIYIDPLFPFINQKHLVMFGTMDSFVNYNGVSGILLKLIIIFLDRGKQRAVLNGQYSSLASVKAGVPQGLILGPPFSQYS